MNLIFIFSTWFAACKISLISWKIKLKLISSLALAFRKRLWFLYVLSCSLHDGLPYDSLMKIIQDQIQFQWLWPGCVEENWSQTRIYYCFEVWRPYMSMAQKHPILCCHWTVHKAFCLMYTITFISGCYWQFNL